MNQIIQETAKMNQTATQLLSKKLIAEQASNEIFFDKKSELIKGVQKVAEAVGSTLGAKGRLVMFNEGGKTKATKDGATVAKSIKLENTIQNYGAELILEGAMKTAIEVGDGTTTTCIIINYILQELLKLEESRNFYNVQKGMNKAVKDIKEAIKELKEDINIENLRKVVFTSSNNNDEIADAIISIYKQLEDWDITFLFHKTNKLEDSVELVHGYELNTRATSIFEKQIKEDVGIILLDYKATALGTNLSRTINSFAFENKKPILFICRDFTSEFSDDLKRHARDYSTNMYAVKLDLYGPDATEQMKDLAYATNAEILDDVPGYALSEEIMGRVKNVIFSPDKTHIIFEEPVDEYIASIQEVLKDVKDEMQILSIQRRLQKLKSVTANYYVGGQTPQEMLERYYRIEDAIEASRAAIKYGVVPGGGVTALKIADRLSLKGNLKSDFEVGYQTVVDALRSTFVKLCQNSYIEDVLDVYDLIHKNGYNCIYNFSTEKYEHGENISIYDTAKTAEVSVEAAVSVCSTILLTSAIII